MMQTRHVFDPRRSKASSSEPSPAQTMMLEETRLSVVCARWCLLIGPFQIHRDKAPPQHVRADGLADDSGKA